MIRQVKRKNRHNFFMSQKSWITWLRYVFLISALLFVLGQIYAYFSPVPGLPPLSERIQAIKTNIDTDDFTFAIVGDNKNSKGIFPQIISEINNDPDISFVVHTGDIIRSPEFKFAQDFLHSLQELNLRKPLLFVAGNHDRGGHPGRSKFVFENFFGPKHYSVCFGKSLFVMVDGSRIGSTTELNWLRETLATNAVDKNLIVFIHQPLFDPRKNPKEYHTFPRQLGRKLLDIFETYHVAHIFSGHIHGYWAGNWESIPYTITAGGGATLYSEDPAHGFYHYIKVRIKNGHIHEQVKKIDGSLLARTLSKTTYYINALPLAALALITGLSWLIALCFFNAKAEGNQNT